MPREKSKEVEEKILGLWIGREEKEFSYKFIVEEMEKEGFNKRTIDRYLFALRNNKLDRRIERRPKRTFYKPKTKFWNEYLHMRQITDQQMESLTPLGPYIVNCVSKSIEESKEQTALLYDRVWKEIGSNYDEANEEDCTDIFGKATDHIIRERPKKADLQAFYRLYEKLIENFAEPLMYREIFSRLNLKEEVHSDVTFQIWQLIKSYMAMWDFLYKHPETVSEMEEIFAEKRTKRQRATKQLKGLSKTRRDRDEEEKA